MVNLNTGIFEITSLNRTKMKNCKTKLKEPAKEKNGYQISWWLLNTNYSSAVQYKNNKSTATNRNTSLFNFNLVCMKKKIVFHLSSVHKMHKSINQFLITSTNNSNNNNNINNDDNFLLSVCACMYTCMYVYGHLYIALHTLKSKWSTAVLSQFSMILNNRDINNL